MLLFMYMCKVSCSRSNTFKISLKKGKDELNFVFCQIYSILIRVDKT